MFMNATSSEALVLVDGATGRPREIRSHGRRVPISAVEAVRDETAAYPLQWGPRQVFVVRAGGQRYRLVHLLREQRWTLETLETSHRGLASAA